MSPTGSRTAPEARAREKIDVLLAQAGWLVQDREDMNLTAGDGIAVREFKLEKGHGYVDYLLFVDGIALGVVEAKPAGYSFTSVEFQAKKYVEGLPDSLTAPRKPLPFAYISTGEETVFINELDPQPRSRPVFSFHRPETLRQWLTADTLDGWLKLSGGFYTHADDTKPSTLRARLRAMPPVELPGLWPNKVRAIVNLEKSLFDDRPRALIQMATGSGKTLLAVTEIYRLIKFGGARRVLFLVDRANLGEQAEKEFQGFRTPDDNRKFNELYNGQRLTSNTIGSSSKVVISTIQRLYSILKGEPELDPEAEEHTPMDDEPTLPKEPLPVVYGKGIPPEFFDVIFIDECHRSIYSLWRQVLEYFDAYLLGLTATPAKHTYGFFNQNVVMEYPHERAVADGVNCDYEVYRVRTSITAAGSTIEAVPGTMVGYRDRQTRRMRWEAPDEDVEYTGADLDRNVVATDQIRLIVQTFRDKVLRETFPDRNDVPKTLIFAKDDSHAEDIVKIVREEFGKGNEFCQKITYKMTGRGVRVTNPDELRAVTPDAKAKTHFLIVDCVGVTEKTLSDTKPLEKNPSVSLKVLLDHVAAGGVKDDYLSSLASRLARIDKQCGPEEKKLIGDTSGGVSLGSISGALVTALDADEQDAAARRMFGLSVTDTPTAEQIAKAAAPLKKAAIQTLMATPPLRKLIIDLRQKFEQIVDEVSKDTLLVEQTGYSPEAREKAEALVKSFESYLAEHKDEIDALQVFYSVPHKKRLRFKDIQALASAISAPPRSWTTEKLWGAYETLEKSKVHGASAQRLLTDIVSLVRFALRQDGELVPHADRVRERFQEWLAQQANNGRTFSNEQR